MTITQLSNLINLIVQNDADMNFYHYGWPSDMNINIQNNSDPAASTGRLFPYVLFMPPSLASRAMDNNTASIYDTYTAEFLITDTYVYNQGLLTYKADTTIEVEQKLQVLAKKLVQYLMNYSDISEPPFNVSDYNIEFDPYRFTAETRSIRIRLTLVFPAICDDSNLDVSFLPVELADIGTQDYEDAIDYCPNLGITTDLVLGASRTGPLWSGTASLTDFAAAILANQFYTGNLNIVTSEFTDTAGDPVGVVNVIGYDTFCTQIPLSVPTIIYNMVVSADFNTGGGVHTINYTISVTMTQPPGAAVDYSTNLYVCQDLGVIGN